ncbi:UbiX family flavin prenyltransferase [Maledivibacter halophilus]|uniref:Flavin prenyltransferase UbiX n=1 Tax=Maledivibacter halophilus TaxID=36842 RepID=A0A1T5KGS7_9FIRM|nr:UbiX family flavin prenyltransferase [Maledivibacter halophilus]SKC62883.1 4-hydroxy-3-polyprenylbenzoate decarboxylase [Maledivibacter halophilus]
MKKRLIVGISGASGAIIGIKILKELMRCHNWESHLVVTKGGEKTINMETGYSLDEVKSMADVNYPIDDIGEAIASGTFKCNGMVIAPCSMKTLAGISSGYSDNLLLRAADVSLKERKKLALITRETPLSKIHLKNMMELSDMGAIIMPPVLSFYNKPKTIEDMTDHIVGKALDIFNIDYSRFKRWGQNNDRTSK